MYKRACLLALLAAVPLGSFAETIIQPEGKAVGYHRILSRNPRPGYLFERFFNSWLEHNDLQSLETFLKSAEDGKEQVLLAFYYSAIHEPRKASALYAELIEAHPDWKELLYYKAETDVETGAYEDAVDALNLLLDKKPDGELQLNALKLQGRSLLRLRRDSEGLAAWQRLLEASDMDPDVAEEVLDMQLAEGLYDEALENCERMLAATDDAYHEVMLRMRRASILVRVDRRSDAIDCLREAFELTGEGSWMRRDVLSRIEHLYRGADDLPGLQKCLDEMLEQWPDSPTLLMTCTGILRSAGKEEEALESARNLVRLVPDSREIKDWYIDRLLEMGQYDEVIQSLERYLERYPDDNTLRRRLAVVNHRAGDDDKTLEWILASLEHSDRTESAYLETARQLARFNLDDEATGIYLQLLEQWPDSIEGREAVATHMSRKSYLHLSLAWKHYEWLAERADTEMLVRLSSVLMAAGTPERAEILLLSRREEFGADYQYLSALFEVVTALDKPEELLAIGFERVTACSTMRELELAAGAQVYEISKNKAGPEWVRRLETAEDLPINHLWLLASLHVADKKPEKADELLLAALEKTPDESMLLECRLLLARRSRNWDRAEAILVQLIETYPAKQALWIRELVTVLVRSDQTDKALEWIEAWKKASPNATRPYELERDTLMAAERIDEAIEAMRRATRKFDESIELKLALGRLYESCSRTADAERLYWRMLNAEENLDQRMARLADLIRIGRQHSGMNKLIQELKRRSDNSPTSSFPLLGLSECYRNTHQMRERTEVLERVLELRPSDVAVLRAKASLEEDLGDYIAVRDLMLRIAELDPTGDAYSRLVEFEVLYGEPSAAAAMLDDPRVAQDPDAFVQMASRLIALGSCDTVSVPLARMIDEHPKDYRFTFLQACLLAERGETAAAAQTFAALLDVEEERPGGGLGSYRSSAFSSASTYSINPMNDQHRRRILGEWQLKYGAWIPDELMEMYSMLIYGAHRYQNSRYNSYSGLQTRSRVDVPDTVEEIERLTLTRLQQLSADLPESELEALMAAVDQHRPYVGLLWISATRGVHTPEWWSLAEARYPDSRELRLLRQLVAGHTIESEEEVRAAVTEFGADHPELSLAVLQQSQHRHPATLEMLPGLVSEEGIGEDNLEMLTQLSIRALTVIPDTNTSYNAVVELFEEVEQRNLAQPDLSQDMRLALAVARSKLDNDYSGIIDLAEEVFNQPVTQQIAQVYGGYSSAASVAYYHRQLSFPPSRLPEVNIGSVYSLGLSDEVKEKVKDALMEHPKDSLFRWLALRQLGAEGEVLTECAEAIDAKDEKTQAELYTLACWHSASNHIGQALECMFELRETEGDLSGGQNAWNRNTLTLIGRMKEIPPEIEDELKKFAEDMKASTLWSDNSTRIQLVDFMERIGVPLDEVVKLAALPGSTSSGSSGGTRAARPRPPDFYQEIRTAIDKGETETALIRVAVLLRSEALGAIYPQGRGQGQNRYHLQNAIQYIRNKGLEDQFLELFENEEGGMSARQRFEQGYAYELTRHRKEAFEAYREAFEKRPDWSGARTRYCIGLAETDPEKAAEVLGEMSGGLQHSFITASEQQMYDGSVSFETRIALSELAMGLLLSNDWKDEQLKIRFVQILENSARNQWYENQQGGTARTQLPGLWHAVEAGSLASGWTPSKDLLPGNMVYWEDEDLLKIQQRRRELYIGLLRYASLNLPSYGLDRFCQWTAYADFSGMQLEADELFEVSRKVLLQATAFNQQHYSTDQGERRDALEVYVLELRRRADWSDAEVLLEEMRGSFAKNALKSLVDLNTAEPDAQYLKKLEELLSNSARGNISVPWVELAFRTYLMNGDREALETLVWRMVEEKVEKKRWSDSAYLVNAWMVAGIKRDMQMDVVALQQRYIDTLFTADERKALAAALPRSISYTRDRELYSKCQQVENAYNSLRLPPRELCSLVQVLAPVGGKMQHSGSLRNLLQRQHSRIREVAWIQEIGLLGETDEFPFSVFIGGRESTMMQLCNQLRGSNGKPLLETINAMEHPTFGSGLLKALLSSHDWNTNLKDTIVYLDEHAEDLRDNPAHLEWIFEWITTTEHNQRVALAAKSFSEEDGLALFTEYAEWKGRNSQKQADAFKALKLADYMRNSYSIDQQAGGIITALLDTGPENARDLFIHIRRLRKLNTAFQGGTYDDQQLLRQMFSRPTYSRPEIHFMAELIPGLDQAAFKWYTDSYLQQMSYRLEQNYRSAGKDYKEARVAVAKDMLEIMLPMGDRCDPASLLGSLDRVDQAERPKLVEWIAEQEFEVSDAKRMVDLYLNAEAVDEEWLKTYFLNEDYTVRTRLMTCSYLFRLRDKKPALLEDTDFLFAMIDLLDSSSPVRFPRDPFLSLVEAVESMPEGAEKDERFYQLLALWQNEKVDGAPSDQRIVYELVALAAESGKDAAARELLGNAVLAKVPRTYAVAMRHRYYDFVETHLPANLKSANSYFPMREVWIPEEAANWAEQYVAGIEDVHLQVFMAAYLAAFPVREGSDEQLDKERWKQRFEEAVGVVEEPELVQWLHRMRRHGSVDVQLQSLYIKYASIVDLMTGLRVNNQDVDAYIAYFEYLETERDVETLSKLLEEAEKNVTRNDYNAHWSNKGIKALIQSCIEVDDERLNENAWRVAEKFEKLKNSKTTQIQIRRAFGMVSYNTSDLGWEKLSAEKRIQAYQSFDESLHSKLLEGSLKKRWEKYKAAGMSDPEARFKARIETVDEILKEIGPSGFAPMCRIIRMSFGLHYATVQENAAFMTHLHTLENDSLMLAQLKAGASLFDLNRYSRFIPDRRAQDVEAYLTRKDLDDVEKVRFVSYARKEGAMPLLRVMENRLPVLEALAQNEALMKDYLFCFLKAFPVPLSPEEYAAYDRILAGLKKLRKDADENTRRDYECRTVAILLAMDRAEEAEKLLDSMCEERLRGDALWAALEGGAVEWCRKRLAEVQALPAGERIKQYRKLDTEISKVWKARHNEDAWILRYFGMGAQKARDKTTERMLDIWFRSGLTGWLPVNQALKNFQGSDGLQKWFGQLDSKQLAVLQAQAAMRAHRPDREDQNSIKETAQLIEKYLTRKDLDAVGRLCFATGANLNNPELMTSESRRAVMDALKAEPGLIEELALPVMQAVSVPPSGKDEALFNQCLDVLLDQYRKAPRKKRGAFWPQIADALPALYALDRKEDAALLLEDPSRVVPLMKHTLNHSDYDWCVQNLESWIFRSCRNRDMKGVGRGIDVRNVNPMLKRVEDADLKLMAEIFFAAILEPKDKTSDLRKLAEQFEQHDFSNAMHLAVSRDILEREGVLHPAEPAPLLKEWAESEMMPEILKRKKKRSYAQEIAFETYLLGMLNAGEIEDVSAFFKKVEDASLGKSDAQWLTNIASRDDQQLCEALLAGEAVPLPPRYSAVDIQERLKLQAMLERISRKAKVDRILINSHVSPGIYLAAGKPDQFKSVWNVSSRRFDLLFAAYVLYSGVLHEEPDEARLQKLIEKFREGVLVYKDHAPGGFFGRYDWHDAAEFIPEVYPFSLNAEKWKVRVPELLPLSLMTADQVLNQPKNTRGKD